MIKNFTAAAIVASSLAFATNSTQAADMGAEGMVTVKSPHDVATTVEKLVAVLESKGMNVFTRINHAEGAAKAGMELRPTELVLFGNPKVGTPLMQCSQTIAIDLPQKMLAWQDEDGTVHLSYNDPMHLKGRHGTEGCDEVLGKVSGALANFAKAATMP